MVIDSSLKIDMFKIYPYELLCKFRGAVQYDISMRLCLRSCNRTRDYQGETSSPRIWWCSVVLMLHLMSVSLWDMCLRVVGWWWCAAKVVRVLVRVCRWFSVASARREALFSRLSYPRVAVFCDNMWWTVGLASTLVGWSLPCLCFGSVLVLCGCCHVLSPSFSFFLLFITLCLGFSFV